MNNQATKPLSRDDGLVARLVVLSNMIHKPDLSAARSGTIVCPKTRVTTPEVSRGRETTPHDTDYVSSLQYSRKQCHDSTKISNQTAPDNRTLGTSGLWSMVGKVTNRATKPLSRDDGSMARSVIISQDIFHHLYQSYGRISPGALQVNTTCLATPISSHLPIALVFRQIEECQRFVIAGGTEFTAEQLIKLTETIILATGK